MQPLKLPCPIVGHKKFEKSLGSIVVGDVMSPEQITKFVRPWSSTLDDLGLEYRPGELQKKDFINALSLFSYREFLSRTFQANQHIFKTSECRIYQFQTATPSQTRFIFGLIITDGSSNLIDFCIETSNIEKRKPVINSLIRAICTTSSVSRKLSH